MAGDEVLVEVTFCRSGLFVNGRVAVEGTVDAIPADLARLTADEQRATLGGHFFDVGAAVGAPRAEHVDVDSRTRVTRLVDIDDAAALLNRGVSTLRRAVHAGRLRPAKVVGNRWLFDVSQVWALHRDPQRAAVLLDGVSANRVELVSSYTDWGVRPSMPGGDRQERGV